MGEVGKEDGEGDGLLACGESCVVDTLSDQRSDSETCKEGRCAERDVGSR